MQVQDAKVLLNTLITGFKHLLYSMVNFGNTTRHPPSRNPAQAPLPSVGLREDEVRLTVRLLTCGVSCLTLYTQTSENRDPISNYADVFAVLTVHFSGALELTILRVGSLHENMPIWALGECIHMLLQ